MWLQTNQLYGGTPEKNTLLENLHTEHCLWRLQNISFFPCKASDLDTHKQNREKSREKRKDRKKTPPSQINHKATKVNTDADRHIDGFNDYKYRDEIIFIPLLTL